MESESLRSLFEDFDRDRSGFITRSEFKRGFDNLSMPCDKADLDELIRTIDTNRDGKVSYSEFVDVYNNDGSTMQERSRVRRPPPSNTLIQIFLIRPCEI